MASIKCRPSLRKKKTWGKARGQETNQLRPLGVKKKAGAVALPL